MHLYQCVLDYQDNADCFIQICWTKASDIGRALERVSQDAQSRNYQSLVIREIQPCTQDDLPFEHISEQDDLWYFPKRHRFDERYLAEPPLGVIPVGDDDEESFDFSDISYGYERIKLPSGGILRIDSAREGFMPLIQNLLALFPHSAQIEFQFSGEWLQQGVAKTHFRRLAPAELTWIRALLDENYYEVLGNGFAELSIQAEGFGLNIGASKTIEFFSNTPAGLEQAQFICRRFGLDRLEGAPSLGEEIFYEPFVSAKAMPAQHFLALLARKGFYATDVEYETSDVYLEDA